MSEPRLDGWTEFVREVSAIANRPEHEYRGLLIVGLRVLDGDIRIDGGASPPLLTQVDGSPLSVAQVKRWRDVMLAAADAALERVETALTCAAQARENGTLQ